MTPRDAVAELLAACETSDENGNGALSTGYVRGLVEPVYAALAQGVEARHTQGGRREALEEAAMLCEKHIGNAHTYASRRAVNFIRALAKQMEEGNG